MKNLIKVYAVLLMLGIMSCFQIEHPHSQRNSEAANPTSEPTYNAVAVSNPDSNAEPKKIKVAILLDTSNSMDGLIEQAKNQLWKIVNQLAKAKDANGNDPEIELALYQYGNDNLSIVDGYVEMVSDFTTELDEISEKLFALRTRGGSEYCGTVIKKSIRNLKWSDSDEDLQMIFIAGNERFTQGSVDYKHACSLATNKNVVVNTIFCGDYQVGINTSWKEGADLTDGKYLNIDHDALIVHINSPYDDDIADLNSKLNNTYIPYGKQGRVKKQKQLREDQNADSYGKANAAKRYLSKGSKVYKNKSWDLVDAADEKDFDIKKIDDDSLPEELKGLSDVEKVAHIEKQKAERLEIKKQMKALNKSREVYVAKEKAKQASNNSNQLDDAIISSIVDQAKTKSFTFEEHKEQTTTSVQEQ